MVGLLRPYCLSFRSTTSSEGRPPIIVLIVFDNGQHDFDKLGSTFIDTIRMKALVRQLLLRDGRFHHAQLNFNTLSDL